LCPAGCELGLAPAGPDRWAPEYPLTEGTGLCARGAALCELFGSARRILWPAWRDGATSRSISLDDAIAAVVDAARDKSITLFLDGNLPDEQLASAAAWADAWPAATLCLVVEPAEEQLLLGIEASGADHLAGADLKDCDGFLIVGDVFAANPRCARDVLDRHNAEPRMPIVAIDSAAGSVAKFATHVVDVPPGGEAAALADLAAAPAGKALAGCKRLGVLLSAEYGRTAGWRRIGYLAGQFAQEHGGGVCAQPDGANVLTAVRLCAEGRAVSLAAALAATGDVKVALGCDVLGILGRADVEIVAAAAALPNETTAAARIVLPTALPGEYGGAYALGEVEPLVDAPAGLLSPGELVAALAAAAGVSEPAAAETPSGRVAVDAPGAAAEAGAPPDMALLFGRDAALAGCGALTRHASWQAAARLPVVRMSPADAERAGLASFAEVTVRAGESEVRAEVRIAPELAPGRVVLPQAIAEARRLAPSRADQDTVSAAMVSSQVTS